jgi:hypothetical protein
MKSRPDAFANTPTLEQDHPRAVDKKTLADLHEKSRAKLITLLI